MDITLLDSGVVSAFLDRSDTFHKVADRKLRKAAGRERLVVSVVTYAELLTGAALGHHDKETVQGFFNEVVDVVVHVDEEIAERAAELRGAKKSLKMPDALILATAEHYPADLVLGSDASWSSITGYRCKVEVISPTK